MSPPPSSSQGWNDDEAAHPSEPTNLFSMDYMTSQEAKKLVPTRPTSSNISDIANNPRKIGFTAAHPGYARCNNQLYLSTRFFLYFWGIHSSPTTLLRTKCWPVTRPCSRLTMASRAPVGRSPSA
ncbi:hypothetical protein VTL71DRAFT_6621, partial [Oculimacula yallundae]